MSKPQTIGEQRRAITRMLQLGLLSHAEPITRAAGDAVLTIAWRFTTAAGETVTLRRRETSGYLRGLAHGSFVERHAQGVPPRGAA